MDPKPFGLAVKAVIRRADGACLLLRRPAASRTFASQWERPGGKVDAHEHFVDALKREVAEECGLAVEPTAFVGAVSFEMPRVRVVLLVLEAEHVGGGPRISPEHEAASWVPPSGFAGLNLADYLREFMLAYAVSRASAGGAGPAR